MERNNLIKQYYNKYKIVENSETGKFEWYNDLVSIAGTDKETFSS